MCECTNAKSSKTNQLISENTLNSIDESNLIGHLYPETGDNPFSDLEDSDNQLNKSISQTVQQKGGIYSDFIAGKSVIEIMYVRNKSNYKMLTFQLQTNKNKCIE